MRYFFQTEQVHDVFLFVFSGPPLVRAVETVQAIEGKFFQVECPASGYPIESITWKKGKNVRPPLDEEMSL